MSGDASGSVTRTEALEQVLSELMHRYTQRVPDVGRVLAALTEEGYITSPEAIENDHIAFRTMGVAQLGIRSFEKIWLHYGYRREDHYHFPVKKLDAFWYSPPEPRFPRIFVSELRVADLSEPVQETIRSYTDEVSTDPVDDLDLDDGKAVGEFLHRPLWRLPSWDDYQLLANESEYAAWVIYNRYYLNHFTISVHNLSEKIDTIPSFNRFVESHGIRLNDSGGKVKTSSDGLLRQSSTVAQLVDSEFAGGDVHEISGSYVEFAERRPLPRFADLPKPRLTREMRREGFEAGNADKIFESTYREQTAGRAAD
ncbi:MAG TPA: DUF1338 domain-containing protein [Trueperaceae bacterium]